jgi:hypothetical protein
MGWVWVRIGVVVQTMLGMPSSMRCQTLEQDHNQQLVLQDYLQILCMPAMVICMMFMQTCHGA